MPTIVFKVNLETLNRHSFSHPFTLAEADNFRTTKHTFFPDMIRDNRKLKHGDQFTETGTKALYLKNNFTSGAFKFLDIVSETA